MLCTEIKQYCSETELMTSATALPVQKLIKPISSQTPIYNELTCVRNICRSHNSPDLLH